jgi:hypothetical protein
MTSNLTKLARYCAAQLAPIKPVPTIATLRISMFGVSFPRRITVHVLDCYGTDHCTNRASFVVNATAPALVLWPCVKSVSRGLRHYHALPLWRCQTSSIV